MNPVLDPSECRRSLPEADLRVSKGLAQCSLWWNHAPQLPVHKVGCIGSLLAPQGCSIKTVLDLACRQLQRQGCTLAIGPMDGSTWKPYRLVTQSSPVHPFLFDVGTPPEWHQQFLEAGFYQIASYASSLVPDLSIAWRDMRAQEEGLGEVGIRIRCFHLNQFDSELRTIYNIALEAFADSFLFTTIDWQEFSLLYYPLRESIRTDFVLIAEMRGQPVGFIFAMPDLLQSHRGEKVDTVIIKSLGVLPPYRGLGLGSVLVERIHRTARNQGYRRAIHALMRSDNTSVRISAHSGQVVRRYGLLARHLEVQL